jgi:hypothetical protein
VPFVDPQTVSNPTTGQPATAAWGDAVRDGLVFIATNFPHCSVYNSGAQSCTDDALTKLTANSELSDIGGMHSTSVDTSRITIPSGEGGLYVCTATVSFDASATGERLLRFLVDNTTVYVCQELNTNTAGSRGTTINGSRTISLAAGSYIEVQVRQNSTGALNCTLQDFSVRWIATA